MMKLLGLRGRGVIFGLAAFAALAGAPHSAPAAIQDFYDGAVFNSGTTMWTYTYHGNLTTGEFIQGTNATDDFTTIYALSGVSPATVVTITPGAGFNAASFTVSIQPIGKNPDFVAPGTFDRPGIYNISVTYTGNPGVVNGPVTPLFSLSFSTTFSPGPNTHDYGSEAHDATGRVQNFGHNLGGPVFAPFVPEPASITLVSLGLPLLGLMLRRKMRAPA
jgi:hypothetical protein